MTNKYTSGPWNIEHVPNTVNNFRLWDENNNYMCDMSDETQEANARLMAAAPDLLEALIYARRFLDNRTTDCVFIDAAIKKAKGE